MHTPPHLKVQLWHFYHTDLDRPTFSIYQINPSRNLNITYHRTKTPNMPLETDPGAWILHTCHFRVILCWNCPVPFDRGPMRRWWATSRWSIQARAAWRRRTHLTSGLFTRRSDTHCAAPALADQPHARPTIFGAKNPGFRSSIAIATNVPITGRHAPTHRCSLFLLRSPYEW